MYAITVAAIASIYTGCSSGRQATRLVVEIAVATAFIVMAAIALGAPSGALCLT